jgi:MFS superfamily sulfate permease-like transporter
VTVFDSVRKLDRRATTQLCVARTRRLLPRSADLRAMTRHPRQDVIAGMTVALVALPLALAFGISSGLGAGAGIVTAIVAGVLAAIFGGSNVQVSGPTGAMTVVLMPIFSTFGADGVLLVGVMAGIMLIALAYAGAGRYMRYVPLPVVEGFTLGIAAIIGLQQVPAALGVHASGEKVVAIAVDAVRLFAATPKFASLAVALGVAAAMLFGARFRPELPVSAVAVVVSAIIVATADLQVGTIGRIPSGLPRPSLPAVTVGGLQSLLAPALAVALLAALEGLLSATVADVMTGGERHHSDRELFGQGIANLVTPLFGGIPATAAIARTAVNVRSGARSRLAAVTQSGALLVVVLVGSQFVSYIPLAALAGVLIATAVHMIQASSVVTLLHSTRGDAVALVVTAVATIALDLVAAVILGLLVAGAFALHAMARSARLDEMPLHDELDPSIGSMDDGRVVVYRLDGPLFFGAAHAFASELSEIDGVSVVVLRMSAVATLDATGASVLADTIKRLEARHVTVLLSGIRAEHSRILSRLGVFDEIAHERHIFDSAVEAVTHARMHVGRVPHPAAHVRGVPPTDAGVILGG